MEEGLLVSFYAYVGLLLLQLVSMLNESMQLFNLIVSGMEVE